LEVEICIETEKIEDCEFFKALKFFKASNKRLKRQNNALNWDLKKKMNFYKFS